MFYRIHPLNYGGSLCVISSQPLAVSSPLQTPGPTFLISHRHQHVSLYYNNHFCIVENIIVNIKIFCHQQCMIFNSLKSQFPFTLEQNYYLSALELVLKKSVIRKANSAFGFIFCAILLSWCLCIDFQRPPRFEGLPCARFLPSMHWYGSFNTSAFKETIA